MRCMEYGIGQKAILRGPLKCLKETAVDSIRPCIWHVNMYPYVGAEVFILSSKYVPYIRAGITKYRILMEGFNKTVTISAYHHWLAPIEDDTFGFLYKKE